MSNLTKISATWDKVWQDKNNLTEWDYLSQIVVEILISETPFIETTAIEVGSGSGRISHKLAQLGAKVTLLDISQQAIKEGEKLFQSTNHRCHLIRGSLFQIPCRNSSYDVVWNAGVVEHYLNDELESSLKEMSRVCHGKGLVIVIVPYAGSFLHTIGKASIEKFLEYPFGGEYPIKTLKKELEAISCKFAKKEYSIGFFVLFVGAFKRVMLFRGGNVFKPILKTLNRFFINASLHPFFGPILKKLDLKLSKLFGGYLLVSVFNKK